VLVPPMKSRSSRDRRESARERGRLTRSYPSTAPNLRVPEAKRIEMPSERRAWGVGSKLSTDSTSCFAPWLNVIRRDGTGLTRIPVEGTPAESEMPDWIGA